MWEQFIDLINNEVSIQFKSGSGILLLIVSASYMCSLFSATTEDQNGGLKDIISFAAICLLCVPIVENIKDVIENATQTIEEVRTIMLSSIPALCASDVGSGAAGAAVFITLTQSAAVLLSEIFLPLALVYTIIGICASVSNKFSLDGVKGMVKFVFSWGLGIMMIVFSCTATLSGALTGARASMASRTLKYTGAMVPVVGRYLAESADMVFAGASVIKSTAGIAAVTGILTIAIAPCVKMATHVLVYRIAGILIRPVADAKISNAITNVGDAFMMITGITALMSVMSILNVAVLVTLVRGGA